MTSIWFPNNKYPPNTKNYLPCFVLGGGFSIRRKGLIPLLQPSFLVRSFIQNNAFLWGAPILRHSPKSFRYLNFSTLEYHLRFSRDRESCKPHALIEPIWMRQRWMIDFCLRNVWLMRILNCCGPLLQVTTAGDFISFELLKIQDDHVGDCLFV